MSHNTFSTNASRIIFQKSHHSLGKLSFITHIANKGHGQSIKNLYHINHSLNNCVKAVTSLVSHNWDIYPIIIWVWVYEYYAVYVIVHIPIIRDKAAGLEIETRQL